MRKILHVDMDAFFASVEQRDVPELRGLPVIVGGKPDSRGVVAACSYEARKFGVRSAMPSSQAAKLCKDAIFVPPRFEAYREASDCIHAVFKQFTGLIEPLSLDEAYLDVTESAKEYGSATQVAQEIKQKIKSDTDLTASAGVSFNKFLAKIASDMDKPNGLYIIRPEEAEAFVEQLDIRKFFGVGKVTEQKMHRLGIYTGADLKKWSEVELQTEFGQSGAYYYRVARGIDERPVRVHRVRKSIGKETTFANNVLDKAAVWQTLLGISERSKTSDTIVVSKQDIISILPELLRKTEVGVRPIRLIGVTLANLHSLNERDTTAESEEGKHNLQLGLF